MHEMTTDVAVVGAGPAGLMAAQELALAGWSVHLFYAMPSVGRNFLLAGKGGMNLTHSEPLDRFMQRYGEREPQLAPLLQAFGPDQVRAWARAWLDRNCSAASSSSTSLKATRIRPR